MIEEFAITDQLDELWNDVIVMFRQQNLINEKLAARIVELEKNAHKPVTFVADENGFLKIAKESE